MGCGAPEEGERVRESATEVGWGGGEAEGLGGEGVEVGEGGQEERESERSGGEKRLTEMGRGEGSEREREGERGKVGKSEDQLRCFAGVATGGSL